MPRPFLCEIVCGGFENVMLRLAHTEIPIVPLDF